MNNAMVVSEMLLWRWKYLTQTRKKKKKKKKKKKRSPNSINDDQASLNYAK